MVKDLGMVIDTFGSIGWRGYYSLSIKRREEEARAKAWAQKRAELAEMFTRVPQELPCLTCKWEATPGGCGRGVDPDRVACCSAFVKYFRIAWPEIAEGIKRAAPELEPPKAAKENEYAPIVTGAEGNVKEGQDGLLQ